MNPQRLDLNYDIVWQGRWHVGSGYGSATADRLLQRMGGTNGDPFVPGSQIKGVLRHHCERLALALDLEAINPHERYYGRQSEAGKAFHAVSEVDLGSGSVVWQPLSRGVSVRNECLTCAV